MVRLRYGAEQPMKGTMESSEIGEEIARRNGVDVTRLAEACSDSTVLNPEYNTRRLHIKKAYGCFIEDYTGHVYVDTGFGAGTHILGHTHPVIVKELQRQASEGTLLLLPNHYTYEVRDLLHAALPHFSGFAFCNSGVEATMRAARIARAFTGRDKVAMFSGGWHGGNDLLLFEDDNIADKHSPVPVFKSAGLPESVKSHMLFLPYNDENAFNLIEQHKDDLAAVFIEPAQGSNPRDDVGPFLKTLRELTKRHGVLLCFDELVTGFRIALGGCQEYYDINADIATYGKTIGGGISIGMVAVTKDLIGTIRGDTANKPVFLGGTFSANPLAMSVVRVVLRYLLDRRHEIYSSLNGMGKHLRNSVNDFCVSSHVPVRMIGIGSMSRLIFSDKTIRSRRDRDEYELPLELQEQFYYDLLLGKGIHVSSNRIVFISTAHKKHHVQNIAEAMINCISHFSEELFSDRRR
jgi:glutamate-1-semialdehyde 2,1-aminomutase